MKQPHTFFYLIISIKRFISFFCYYEIILNYYIVALIHYYFKKMQK